MMSGERPSGRPDPADRERPSADSDPVVCRRRALDLLARREHSRLELERKLLARGHAAAAVASTLDALEEERLLATDRFAESFIRARAARGQGPARIRADLIERGIEPARAATLLADGSFDWRELARRARSKRFGPEPPVDYRERARQARFLHYRGFEGPQIEAALDAAADSD